MVTNLYTRYLGSMPVYLFTASLKVELSRLSKILKLLGCDTRFWSTELTIS